MATTTPWGVSQHSEKLAQGIMQYSTAGHGGIHLSPTRNAQVHPAWRIEGGWYEEDLDWNIVAYHFPEAFPSKVIVVDGKDFRARVDQTLRDWRPREYMAVTGQTLTTEQSRKLREEAYQEAHEDDLICVSAVGDWHEKVPQGMVGVTCCKGGRAPNGRYADSTMRHFLVPRKEYHDHSQEHGYSMGFVVDPARHREIDST
jgi:hypothetical protein